MQKEEKRSEEIFDYEKYMATKKSASAKNKSGKNKNKNKNKQTGGQKKAQPLLEKEQSALTEEVHLNGGESDPAKEEAKQLEALEREVIIQSAMEAAEEIHGEAAEESPAEEVISKEAEVISGGEEAIPAKKEAVEQEIPVTLESAGASKKKKKKNRPETRHDPEHLLQALDDALDEDISEIEEVSQPEEIQLSSGKGGFKRKMYFVVGVVVSVMAVIGFVFTVNFLAGIVGNIVDNTAQKNEFAQLVYPLVIIDPAPFDSPSQLSSDTVLTAAIWDIILYGDKSKYPTEFDVMMIPEIDVELHATNLLGTGLVFNHRDLGSAEASFYYDPETKTYTVPISPKYFPYSPYVENIKRTGENYSLKVGYVSPNPAWMGMDKDVVPQPDKYMEYVVHKNGKDYTVVAIHEVEEWATPSDY